MMENEAAYLKVLPRQKQPASTTAIGSTFPYPRQEWYTVPKTIIFGSNGTHPKTDGIDVSRYQEAINYQQCEADGVKFVVMRCTVGDYYQDTLFEANWDGFGQTNILRAPYIVVAPAWSAEWDYKPVSAQAHWDKFRAAFGDREPELPIVLDCELTRNQSPTYISDLIDDLIWMVNEHYGRAPIIYTRGNWWNANTVPRTSFEFCDLWIARYSETLEHPWEDNDQYKPRDWDAWTFWQYSEEGEIDGIPYSKVDLDWFNGTLEELLCYAEEELPPIDPDPEPPPDVLYNVQVVNCSQLRLRDRPAYPAYNAVHQGWLFAGMEFEVLAEAEDTAGNIWCQLATGYWCARTYGGYTYLEIV